MKRAIPLALVATFLVFGRPATAATIVVDDTDWRPWYFAGVPDQPPGFAKEVLDHCLGKLGHEAQFIDYPILRMFDGLEAGTIDLHVMSHRPERETYLVYGKEPLFTARYRPVVRAGDPLEIQVLSDLDGHHLGHVKGLRYSDAYREYLDRRIEAGTTEETISNESIVRMLVAGRIDAFVNMSATTRWTARELGVEDRIRVIDFDIRSSNYYVVVARRSRAVEDPVELAAQMDACISDLKSSDKWNDLEVKYRVTEEPSREP